MQTGDILFTTCVCYEHVVMFNVIIFINSQTKKCCSNYFVRLEHGASVVLTASYLKIARLAELDKHQSPKREAAG